MSKKRNDGWNPGNHRKLNGLFVAKPQEEIRPNETTGTTIIWSDSMEYECPPARVIHVRDSFWRPAAHNYVITSNMLMGPFFKYGEECEVSDDTEQWHKAKFKYYAPGIEKLVRVATMNGSYRSFKHIRKPVQPEIAITIKINGEDCKLSDISEETLLRLQREN